MCKQCHACCAEHAHILTFLRSPLVTTSSACPTTWCAHPTDIPPPCALPVLPVLNTVPEFFDMHRALPDATAISISSVNNSIDASSNLDRAAAAAGPGGQINIITEMGPVVTHFLGSCSWLDTTTFEYKIHTVRLDLAGRSFSFGLGPFKLENELSFFLTTPEVACARSKLGGTMLLAAEPAKGKTYFNAW